MARSYSVVVQDPPAPTVLIIVAGSGEVDNVIRAAAFTAAVDQTSGQTNPVSTLLHRDPVGNETPTRQVCNILGRPCVEESVGNAATALQHLGVSLDAVHDYLETLL